MKHNQHMKRITTSLFFVMLTASVQGQKLEPLQVQAEAGNAEAQALLGDAYYFSEEANYSEAVKWYRKAAEQGHIRAQYTLGQHYYFGEGVPMDYIEAFTWYSVASESQSDSEEDLEFSNEAQTLLEDMEYDLTPEQIQEVRARTQMRFQEIQAWQEEQ